MISLRPPSGSSAAPPVALLVAGFIVVFLAASLVPRTLSVLPGLLGLAATGLYAVRRKAAVPVHLPTLILCGGAVLLAGISALWALDPGEAIERTGKLAMVLLPGAVLIGLCAAVRNDDMTPNLTRILPGALAIALVIAIGDHLCGNMLYRLSHGVAMDAVMSSYEVNRSRVALALAGLPVLAMIPPGAKGRVIAGAIIVLTLIALRFSESQSAMAAYLIGLGVLYLPGAASTWSLRLCKWGLAAGVLSAPLLAIFLFRHVAPAIAPFAADSTANPLDRMEIWDFVSRYALQNPLLGFGIEATRAVPAFDNAQIYQPGLTLLHPHNGAIQIWMEFGALGAVLSAWCVVWFFRAMPADRRARRIALACLLPPFFVGVVGYGLWQGWWLGLLICVAALGFLAGKARRPAEAGQPEAPVL